MVFNMFTESGLNVGHITALVATEKLGLAVLGEFVGSQLGTIEGSELTGTAFEQTILWFFSTGG